MSPWEFFLQSKWRMRLKPRLNDQTFSSNIVFVTHNMEWLNGQTMFDQTSTQASHKALCAYYRGNYGATSHRFGLLLVAFPAWACFVCRCGLTIKHLSVKQNVG